VNDSPNLGGWSVTAAMDHATSHGIGGWRMLEVATGDADNSYLREMCDTEQGKRYDAFVVTSIPKAAVTKVSSFNLPSGTY
jgi:predicted dienelactone hydrolase